MKKLEREKWPDYALLIEKVQLLIFVQKFLS